MKDIELNKNDFNSLLTSNAKIIRMRQFGKYLLVETDKYNVLTNGDATYHLENYKDIIELIEMNQELYMIVKEYFALSLIKVDNLEKVFSGEDLFAICKEDEEHIIVISWKEKTTLFNIQTKKLIKPKIDIGHMYTLDKGLYVYKNDELMHYVVNEEGDILYDCGSSFPYYHDHNLILSDHKQHLIKIIHDFLNNGTKLTTISKNDYVIADPHYYKGNIVIIQKNVVRIINSNLEELKSIPIQINGEIELSLLEEEILVLKEVESDRIRNIIVSLTEDFVIKHRGIQVLPFFTSGKRTIRGADKLEEDYYRWSLYDRKGNLLTTLESTDSDVIESSLNNKFIFYHVDKKNHNKVYNVDTKELIDVSYSKIKFKVEENLESQNYGYAYKLIDDKEYLDIIDEDLNVLFADIDIKRYQIDIRDDDFSYTILNQVVYLSIPISRGSYTDFREVIIDKEKNTLYDGMNAKIDIIGNYLQIEDEDGIHYRNSKTLEGNGDTTLLLSDDLPLNIEMIDDNISFFPRNEKGNQLMKSKKK